MKSDSLCRILSEVDSGPITDPEMIKQIAIALSECFNEFTTLEYKKLGPRKVLRMEKLVWSSPVLEFDLERHGAVKYGSKLATMEKWRFNLESRTYEKVRENDFDNKKGRLVRKLDSRVDHKSEAKRVANLIQNQEAPEELEWKDANKVKIVISTIVPETNQQTTATRRKKFWTELEELLKFEWKRENQFLVRIVPVK